MLTNAASACHGHKELAAWSGFPAADNQKYTWQSLACGREENLTQKRISHSTFYICLNHNAIQSASQQPMRSLWQNINKCTTSFTKNVLMQKKRVHLDRVAYWWHGQPALSTSSLPYCRLKTYSSVDCMLPAGLRTTLEQHWCSQTQHNLMFVREKKRWDRLFKTNHRLGEGGTGRKLTFIITMFHIFCLLFLLMYILLNVYEPELVVWPFRTEFQWGAWILI